MRTAVFLSFQARGEQERTIADRVYPAIIYCIDFLIQMFLDQNFYYTEYAIKYLCIMTEWCTKYLVATFRTIANSETQEQPRLRRSGGAPRLHLVYEIRAPYVFMTTQGND